MPGVLIVDDEELIRFSLLRSLRKEGIPVSYAENSKSAMEKIGEDRFDVAVVDLHLGDVSGIDVIRHFRRVSPGTKIFVITACSPDSLKDSLSSEGICRLYEKPFDTSQVVNSIHQVMDDQAMGAIERREAERKPFASAFEFSLSILDGGKIKTMPVRARGIDISKTGIGFSADYPLKPGHMLSFNGEVGGRKGIVKWSVPSGDMACRAGVRFVDAAL